MARTRLTWQNVNAPDYGTAIRGAEAANRMFQDALGGLNTSLGSFVTDRKAAQDAALLEQQEAAERGVWAQLASALGDMDAKQKIIQEAGSNPNLRTDFLKDLAGTNYNTFLTGAKARQEYDQTGIENAITNRDQDARDAARVLYSEMLRRGQIGDERGVAQLQQEHQGLIAAMNQADQRDLFEGGMRQMTDRSNLSTAAQNRSHNEENQRWNRDDRSERRLVEDLVGAARAESPFIDEQQALIATRYRNGDITPRMYEQATQQLQRAASGGTGGGGGGTGTAAGGGSTLIDPRPSPLDPNSPYSSPEVQDIVQNVNDVVGDLTRGAGTVASRGVQRSDAAKAADISPDQAVARVMEAEAFKNADPSDVQYAIYEIFNEGKGNITYAQAADILAMSPSRGRSFISPRTWFNNTTYNDDLARNIANQWTSPNLGRDRETLQEIEREQANLQEAEASIIRKGQKLDEMVNHAFRNGLSQDSPAIQDLQVEIQLDLENLGKEAERVREENLGERVRNPATGEYDYPANIREEEAKAARSREEARIQAEEDARIANLSNRHLTAQNARRIRARLEEMEEKWGRETLMNSRWANGEEYRRLRAELNRANQVLQGN